MRTMIRHARRFGPAAWWYSLLGWAAQLPGPVV